MLYYCPHLAQKNDLRRQGFKNECEKLGCRMVNIRPPAKTLQWPAYCAHLVKQIKKADLPAAVFAFEDIYATEILDAALSAGLRVPEDVSILGANNDELICETLTVPLSSIENNLIKVGYEAAALLDRLIDGEDAPTAPILIPPEPNVIVRKSTDTYAISHAGLSKALDYIKAHFNELISVADVAYAAAMSESSLRQLFKEQLGHGMAVRADSSVYVLPTEPVVETLSVRVGDTDLDRSGWVWKSEQNAVVLIDAPEFGEDVLITWYPPPDSCED